MTIHRLPRPAADRRRDGVHPVPSLLRRIAPTSWVLWREPPRVLAYVLVVDVAAVVVGVTLAASRPVTGADLVLTGLLALGAAVHVEVARRTERPRETAPTADDRPDADLTSTFGFAGLLLLPLGPALLLVLGTVAARWVRVPPRVPAHRGVLAAAAAVLGSCAAVAVVRALGVREALTGADGALGLLGLCLAVLVRWAVHRWVVLGAGVLGVRGVPWRARVGPPADHLPALGALALGVVVGALADVSLWLVPVLLVPLVTMHRGVLVPRLVRAVRVDTKTGAATASHWRAGAERELARARRRGTGTGVLMVDLDEFKAVNDAHGHLAGDHALRAVAEVLARAVRAGDVVGRFGGEEFVVLLCDVDAPAVLAAAERIRRGVAGLQVPLPAAGGRVLGGLTVSVGAAHHAGGEESLEDLVLAADSALYGAKRAGRNRVHGARPPGSLDAGALDAGALDAGSLPAGSRSA